MSRERIGLLVELARPFTLLPPLVGFLAGAAVAFGASPSPGEVSWLRPALGCLMAAALNAASNALNQVCDLEIDRVAKPDRVLPSGRLSVASAQRFTASAAAAALVLAWFASPPPGRECFWIALVAGALVFGYSAPPLRTKRLGWLANLTVALPRGLLLPVAGWSSVRTAFAPEPWFVGFVFGLFLLGAATTKDFADLEGDRAGGCRTLPVRYGVRGAAWRIAPFFVLPFPLLPIGSRLGLLTGDPLLLDLLGAGLAAYGVFVAWLMLRRPGELATEANHVSWRHMYLMMLLAQIGLAVAYLA